ncbi:MAG: hypothetical protein M0C28_26155 [Candidatus Moduliflexus flocculans]|nr:hypothetical protein [Candidatus Moduliflexus flocculans]
MKKIKQASIVSNKTEKHLWIGIHIAKPPSEIYGGGWQMKKAFYITGVAFGQHLPLLPIKPLSQTAAGQVKANPVRIAKMNATEKRTEISDKAIKIERTVKNNVETMQFVLDKPTENIATDAATAYVEKDGIGIPQHL